MFRFFSFSLVAMVLFASCAGGPGKQILTPQDTAGAAEVPKPYVVTDYKNRAKGEAIPGWVSRWLEGGDDAVEAMEAYQGRFVFIARNEGSNFNALTQWKEGFSADLDFPRLAAARIEARFSAGVHFPDSEYGSFFEALIRAASDAPWTGAAAEDDFWIRRKFFFTSAAGENTSAQQESWEFLVLVTIDKNLFSSQLNGIFQNLNPTPRPSRDQIAAATRVKDKFYDGF
ncbi:MAG: hypothetical protein FWC45_05725 [Treponema sp.]|nr:hypothetical protein [Treponema sp.]